MIITVTRLATIVYLSDNCVSHSKWEHMWDTDESENRNKTHCVLQKSTPAPYAMSFEVFTGIFDECMSEQSFNIKQNDSSNLLFFYSAEL